MGLTTTDHEKIDARAKKSARDAIRSISTDTAYAATGLGAAKNARPKDMDYLY